jgi:hypothetical protein
MESNLAAPTMFDTLLENCIFYISQLYEFSHRLGHSRQTNAANGFAGCLLCLQQRPNFGIAGNDAECQKRPILVVNARTGQNFNRNMR